MQWLYLSVAIVAEVIATSALKTVDGWSRPTPLAVVAIGYGIAFYFLALTLRTLPIGIAYAIWSGAGIVLISGVAWWRFHQSLDLAAILGITLILLGVVIINVFSTSVSH